MTYNEGRDFQFYASCKECDTQVMYSVNKRDYTDWRNGKLIQNALPYLSKGKRELLISGLCETCFDHLLNQEEI